MEYLNKYYLFLDETGDHNLTPNSIDRDEKFGLAGVLCSKADYFEITDKINKFKFKYWKEGKWKNKPVILHSYEIRHRRGAFGFLSKPENKNIKEEFFRDLNKLIESLPITVFGAIIYKKELKAKYKEKLSPYNISLGFILERVFYFSKERKIHKVKIIAESRGYREDADLQHYYQEFLERGSYYLRDVVNLRELFYKPEIKFSKKIENKEGLQIADLCVYQLREIADYVVKEGGELSEPSIIVKNKLRHYNKKILRYGLKIFPEK